MRADFFKAASIAPSVVCCRCAPTQKSRITEELKIVHKKVVCGIGDGGNDVGMIMSASIGIGIEGKEGMQAALCSDFSVREFRAIRKLFLWHGRLSYVRTSLLANFIIHRGLIISVI
jgi:phospholipid-translocating ATPase